MKLYTRALGFLAFGLAIIGCQKDDTNSASDLIDPQSFSEIKAPQGFTFNGFNAVDVNLELYNPGFQHPYTVKVYDQMPTAGGQLMHSSSTVSSSFSAKVEIPDYLKSVVIQINAPDGSSTFKKFSIEEGAISYNFNASDLNFKNSYVSTDCNTGCDQSYANFNSNLIINSNDQANIFCINGTSGRRARIYVNKAGVTIRICGSATLHQLTLNNGSSVEITDGSTLTVRNLSINGGGSFTVYDAQVNTISNFSPSGPVVNWGDLNISGDYNIYGTSTLTNNGTINVSGRFNNNSAVDNNGTLDISSDGNFNGSSSFTNNCSLIAGGKLQINSGLTNNGYIEAADKVSINSGSQFTMNNGAMLYGKKDAVFNNNVNGTNSTSLLKFDTDVTLNSGGAVSGNLELCVGGSLTNYGNILAPASLACNVYIPTTGCNTMGNGSPQVADADNDGIADENDAFVNDPVRSGLSYYPAQNQYATLAFEDLWPSQGDYDFNDLVLDYQYEYVTNASNELVDLNINYSVRAIGAGRNNGFALELDINPSAIASITNSVSLGQLFSTSANGTESGQPKAVIPFFDRATDVLPNPGSAFVNTVKGNAYSTPDTNQIAVSFNSGIAISDLGSAPFNPFIVNGSTRGHEIHMANSAPTALADNSFFGNGVDDSELSSGRYYVTSQNLPWAINVATTFDYPVEKEDIVSAYSNFASWAQSGGSTNANWFLDIPGQRVSSKIY